MLDYCGGWDKHACWFLGQMSKYMVNRQRNMRCVGVLSTKPSRAWGRTPAAGDGAEDGFLD